MFLTSAVRRRRPFALSNPESLETRALLSVANGAVADSPVAVDVATVGRGAVPRIFVAGDDYTLSSSDLGDGSLVITQNGNNIHGDITAAKVQFASFDASFRKEKAKVARGTLEAVFIGEDVLKEAKFRIKFRPDGDGFSYSFNRLRFRVSNAT